ncbi:MAG: lipoprotein [Pseudomonadota bacterium]
MPIRRPRTLARTSAGLIAGCALLLSACGNKGPLTLPPRAPTAKAKAAAQPPAVAPQPAEDHSSTTPPAPQ